MRRTPSVRNLFLIWSPRIHPNLYLYVIRPWTHRTPLLPNRYHVVFTGSETKIMLNGDSTSSKRSKIEKETNFNVIANFVPLFALGVAAAVGSGVYDGFGDTSREVGESSADPTHILAVLGAINFA